MIRDIWGIIVGPVDFLTEEQKQRFKVVLLLDMVDNSTSPCELVSGWFYPYLTVQAGRFIL